MSYLTDLRPSSSLEAMPRVIYSVLLHEGMLFTKLIPFFDVRSLISQGVATESVRSSFSIHIAISSGFYQPEMLYEDILRSVS